MLIKPITFDFVSFSDFFTLDIDDSIADLVDCLWQFTFADRRFCPLAGRKVGGE